MTGHTPYTSWPPQGARRPTYGVYSETTPINSSHRYKQNKFCGRLTLILCLGTILISATITSVFHAQSGATKAEIERLRPALHLLRREFENEIIEQENVRRGWREEADRQEEVRRSWHEEAAKYDAQCLARAEDRLREEDWRGDAEKRAKMNLYWDGPTPAPQCSAFGVREYTARLWNIAHGYDWMRACKSTPINLPGNIRALPDRCAMPGAFSGVIGHWLVTAHEHSCEPKWGKFFDKECVRHRIRRVESRLWDVHKGEDPYHLCSTAPAKVHGANFDRPTYCEEREHDKAMIGNWEVDDASC